MRVAGLRNSEVVQIGAGWDSSCVLRSGGRVFCRGRGDAYQPGNGTNQGSDVPVPVSTLLNARELSVGDFQNCAVRNNGRVSCWGSNVSGELGDGSFAVRPTPVTVVGLRDAVPVSAGGPAGTSCAIQASGQASAGEAMPMDVSGSDGRTRTSRSRHSRFV